MAIVTGAFIPYDLRMDALRLFLFGRVESCVDGRFLEIKSRKALALLAYLAVMDQAFSRDHLAALFWPEADEKRARNSLSRELYQLKQTPLGEQIAVSGDDLRLLRDGLWVDVNQFSDLVEKWRSHEHGQGQPCTECMAALSAAAGLYRDDFLADFFLADANEFEDWAAAQRERLRRMALRALEALGQATLAAGTFDQARKLARRQLEIDDLSETAVVLLMESLARSGHRREALAEFERFRARLWAEMAVEVSPGTEKLVEDIQAGRLAPKPEIEVERQVGTADPSQERQALRVLLEKVKSFWVESVLENSLHGAALIELGKELRPGEVDYPWGLVMQRPGDERYELPSGLSMVDVFDDNGQALLILGEPGAGKTTMMIDLARALISRAEMDETRPIPVVFNLSSWHDERLIDWLQRELNEKYLIPGHIGKRWLQGDLLLPLLDGLDEVGDERRKDCVAAINGFRQEHGLVPLVICSRVAAYEALPVKLKLESAILLQPLSDEQIESYMAAAGQKLEGVRQLVEADQATRELARSPLMLSVLSLAYQDAPIADIVPPTNVPSSRERLFSAYIKRMFDRRGLSAAYGEEETTAWLAWLARTSKWQGESLFLIERLQPNWLADTGNQRHYVLLSRVTAAALYMVFIQMGLLASQILAVQDQTAWIHFPEKVWSFLTMGILMGLLMALVYWFWAGRKAAARLGREEPTLVWRQIGSFLIVFACGVLAFWPVLLINLVIGFGAALRPVELLGLSFAPAILLAPDLILAIAFAAVVFGFRGAERRLDHDIRAVETLRWSWRSAVLGALGLGALGLLFSPLINDFSGANWPQQVMYTIGFGVVLGAVFLGSQVGIQAVSARPNQGIRLSWRYAWRYTLLITVVGSLYGLAASYFLFPSANGVLFSDNVINVLTTLPYLAVSAFFWYGGLELAYHFWLRFLLWRAGAAPTNYARFLDYASQMLFLRKVGGGYTFVHELLRDHFAAMEPRPVAAQRSNRGWLVPAAVGLLIVLGWLALFSTYRGVRDENFWEGNLADPLAGQDRPLVSGDANCALRSLTYELERRLTFQNEGSRPLGVYWRGYDGDEHYYGPLVPGGQVRFASTAVTMAYCLRDLETGEPVLGYVISPDSPAVVVVRP